MSEADGEALFVRMWRDSSLVGSAHESGEAVRLRHSMIRAESSQACRSVECVSVHAGWLDYSVFQWVVAVR